MAAGLYLCPVTGSGTRSDPRKVAALSQVSGASCCFYFGGEPWALLAVANDPGITGANITQIQIGALDSNLTAAQVTNVSNVLANANLPTDKVSTAITWRQLIRAVCGIFSFAQRFNGRGNGSIYTGGFTLSSTISQLPAGVVTELQNAASDLGLSTAGITGASTIGQVLDAMATQYAQIPFLLGPVTI